jgi:hypothetical protein
LKYGKYFLFTLAFIILAIYSSRSCEAAVIAVMSGGDSFIVQGSGLDGVAGIQLDISYDSTSMNTPTVTQGGLVSGALMAANTSVPGLIKIAIISTRIISGNGQIATIRFASKGSSAPLPSVSYSMIDSKGASIGSPSSNQTADAAPSGFISNAGVPFSQQGSTTPAGSTNPGSTTQTGSTTPTSPNGKTPTYMGTVTLPSDQQQRAEAQPSPSSTPQVNPTEAPPNRNGEKAPATAKADVESKVEETQQYVVYKGVVDRFRQYNGSKKLSEMVKIFDKKVSQTVTQEPAIALSNGQNKVTLTVNVPVKSGASPNFAVNGGTLVSFKQVKLGKGQWLVEVLPELNASKTTLTIITGAEEFEYPLTVAPPLGTTLTLDERGWNKFLKEAGTADAPLHDLNKDGVRDYIDEYIFIANYLASKAVPVKSVESKTPKNK